MYTGMAEIFGNEHEIVELNYNTFKLEEGEEDEGIRGFDEWREVNQFLVDRAYSDFLFNYYTYYSIPKKRLKKRQYFTNELLLSLPYVVTFEGVQKLSCYMLREISSEFDKNFSMVTSFDYDELKEWLQAKFLEYFGVEVRLYLSTEGVRWSKFLKYKFEIKRLGIYLFFPIKVEPLYYTGLKELVED
jgi:hypothetical protein